MAIFKLPSKSLLTVSICLGGIAAFIFASLYPDYLLLSELDDDIQALQSRIDEQKILAPVFKKLSVSAGPESPCRLPFPAPLKLPRSETGKIAPLIKHIVERNQFKLERITTDIDALMHGTGLLSVNVVISGEFQSLRNVLLQLFEVPYLRHIEQILIQPAAQKKKQVELKLWIAQE